MGEEHPVVDAFLVGHFGGHVGAHDVAGMVEHDQENARVALGQAQRFEHLGRAGRGEDVADDAEVQRPCADEAAEGRFMAGPAEGDERDLVGRLGLGAADDFVGGDGDEVAVGDGKTLEQFLGEVLGVVDEFFHGHGDSSGGGDYLANSRYSTGASPSRMKATRMPGSGSNGGQMTFWPTSASSRLSTV